MSAAACQRWRDGRASFSRAPIVRSQFDVEPIADDTTARSFVECHHYSASYPAARERFGLYQLGALVGVVVFSHPTNDATLTNTFANVDRLAGVELGRLVLLDEVGANAESYFVARCFDRLRMKGYRGVISFSDPVPRVSRVGQLIMPGHVGTVYQALNGRYLGRGTPRTLRVLPDGTVLSARTLQKIRKLESGWRAAVDRLLDYGAPPFDGDPRAWVRRAVEATTEKLRHPGNHKYAWALDRRVELPNQVYAYPKKVAA